jgi:hypothetical protein
VQVYPEDRLGAGSQGSQDVRNHPYFSAIDWDKIQNYKWCQNFVSRQTQKNNKLS